MIRFIFILCLLIFPLSVQAGEVHDRVMKTGTVRCGYYPYEPGFIYDANTKEISGIIPAVLENVSARLNLKFEYVEEITLATATEGLRTNRFDMICSPLWALADRARDVVYGEPLWYSGVGVYVRPEDERFTDDIEGINSPDVTIAAIDGSIPSFIAAQDFPKAKVASLPDTMGYSHNLLTVATGKADVTFVEMYQAEAYLNKNPGSLKNITPHNPLRVYPNSVVLPQDDFAFFEMINIALREQLNNGTVDQIIKDYNQYEKSLYPVAKPYEVPR